MKRNFLIIVYLTMITLSLGTVYYYLRIPALSIERTKVSPVLTSQKELSRMDQMILKYRKKLVRYPTEIEQVEQPGVFSSVSGLWADRCEVSQGDFYRFADKANSSQKQILPGTVPANWKYESSSEKHLILGKEEAPANTITFYDAIAYCKSADGRLPNSIEWNALAAGKESNLYPWGNEFKNDAWKQTNTALNISHTCNSIPQMNTPQGLNGMGSNVSEWTMGDFPFGEPTISGGNGSSKIPELTALSFYRKSTKATHRSKSVGFRCVYDRDPAKLPEHKTPINAVRIPDGLYKTGTPENTVTLKLLKVLSAKEIIKLPLYLNSNEYNKKGSFEISKYEITVDLYRFFLNDPLVHLRLYANAEEPVNASYTPFDWEHQQKNLHHPVRGLNWWAADAFARWAGGKLPSEEEWTQVFRNGKNRIYLYGNDFDPEVALTREIGWGEPVPGGMMEKDKTETGVYDLMGNVSEWTRSLILNGKYYEFTVKGGSYLLPGKESSQIQYSRTLKPESFANDVGLRIVFD